LNTKRKYTNEAQARRQYQFDENRCLASHNGTTGSRFAKRGLRCGSVKTVAQSHIRMGAGDEERTICRP
jgi:hypothetical protein